MNTDVAMDNLSGTMESTHLEDGPQEPEHLLFDPKEDSGLPQTALDHIPRYLFRVVSPRSDGITDEKWVRSEAVKRNLSGSREDIFFNLDPSKKRNVARTLNLHLRWWREDEMEDNFVSWTSSLLFAIQYIYYRHLDSRDRSSLEEIKLYVVDTTLFHPKTFLRDLDLIHAFRDFDDHRDGKNLANVQIMRNKPNLYFGEYLSQGSLKIANKCQVISAESLFENDRLRGLQPHFADLQSSAPSNAKVEWAREVVRLRGVIWPERGFLTHLQVLSSAEMSDRLQAVEEIVRNVAPGWKYPLAVNFAALMGAQSTTTDQGTAYDNVFFEYFRSESFDCEHIGYSCHADTSTDHRCSKDPRRPSGFRLSPGFRPIFRVIDSDTMPELKHVKELALEIHKHCNLKRALGQCISHSLLPLSVAF